MLGSEYPRFCCLACKYIYFFLWAALFHVLGGAKSLFQVAIRITDSLTSFSFGNISP
jgi:hypothetical protein